jgi:hypothetical protein
VTKTIPDIITVDQLDAMSDTDFAALFAGGPAIAGLILSLGQGPDLGPQCPGCLNPKMDCICDQIEVIS